MSFALASCLMFLSSLCVCGNITSIGSYKNEEFQWAVGIPFLEFNYQLNCADKSPCALNWMKNGGLIGKAIWQEGECTDTDAATCIYKEPILLTNVTCNDTLATFNISVSLGGTIVALDYKIITLKHCPDEINNSAQQLLNVLPIGPHSYNSSANCSCMDGNGRLRYSNGSLHTAKARCNESAEWDGCSDAECWYVAENVTVHQIADEAGEIASFDCSYENGFPKADYNQTVVGQDVIGRRALTYLDHGQSYFCEVVSNYSELVISNERPKSNNGTLNVFFGPNALKSSIMTRDSITKNSSKPVVFSFRAHDRNGNVTAKFFRVKDNFEVAGNLNRTNHTTYAFHSSIFIDNDEEYGFYEFQAETLNPNKSVSKRVEIFNPSDQLTTPKPENVVNYALIGGLLIGGLVALTALLAVIFVVRRHTAAKRGSKAVREERSNEIYGSSPGTTGTVQVKEDKSNILYVSSTGNGGFEEAYAEVDKRKKKSKGNDNSAYNPEVAEVTYAAVNKQKKKENTQTPQEAVYSEVDKKKKCENGADLESDLHG